MASVNPLLKIALVVVVVVFLVGVYILTFGHSHPTPEQLGDLRG